MSKRWMDEEIAKGVVADELKIGRDAPKPPWYAEENLPEIPLEQLAPEPWPGYNALMRDMQDVNDRVFHALERTPEKQKPWPIGKSLETEVTLNTVNIAQLKRRVAEQSAIIVGQRAAIEELRGWVQERADGVSNLGMRVAKLEDGGCNASKVRDDVLRHQVAAAQTRAEKDRTWTRDLIATWRKELGHKIDEERRAWQDADVSLLRVHGPVHLRLNEDMQANLSRLDQLEAHAQRVCKQFPQVATQTTEEDNRE